MLWGLKKNQQNEEVTLLADDVLAPFYPQIDAFLNQINQIILDKPEQTQLALCSLLAGGHLLFEDLPGLGKTTLASS